MEALKRYTVKNVEQVFVLLILTSIVAINYFIPFAINYFIPFKLVFLNVYFIVILLGTYYLGVHRAVLGGVLCTLLVIIHVYYFPSFFMPAFTDLDLWMNILAWSSFLILTGGVVGRLIHGLKIELEEGKENEERLKSQVRTLEELLNRLAPAADESDALGQNVVD